MFLIDIYCTLFLSVNSAELFIGKIWRCQPALVREITSGFSKHIAAHSCLVLKLQEILSSRTQKLTTFVASTVQSEKGSKLCCFVEFLWFCRARVEWWIFSCIRYNSKISGVPQLRIKPNLPASNTKCDSGSGSYLVGSWAEKFRALCLEKCKFNKKF